MLQKISKQVLKAATLIPPKYYLGAAGVAAATLLYGIGHTLITPVVVPKTAAVEKKSPPPLLVPRQTAAVSPDIAAGNIFRKQRKNFAPPAVAAAPVNEPVPDIKLLGLIISDRKRLAIVDAELKRYFKREIASDLVVSGVRQGTLGDDGHFFEVVPMKGEKLASQTFNEGDIIAEFRLERINEDSIEVTSLASGRRTLVYLMDADEAAGSLSARTKHLRAETLKEGLQRQFRESGAVTR